MKIALSGVALLRQPSSLCRPCDISLRPEGVFPRGGALGSPESFIFSPEAPLLGELSSDSETERLKGRIACPGCSCFRYRDPEVLPQIERLLCPTSPSSLWDATSPSRGGFGSPESFISSPVALPLGELASKARLRGRASSRESRRQGPPFYAIKHFARSVQTFPTCQWLSLWESCRAIARLRGRYASAVSDNFSVGGILSY